MGIISFFSKTNKHIDRVENIKKEPASKKALIGVCPLWDETKDSFWMLPGYINGILEAGGIPVMLPLTSNEEDIRQLLDTIDGILLTGGHDVSPEIYGEKPINDTVICCEERDEMEKILLKLALEQDKPILGICRGIQIMNALLGGTLYQDLPVQHPSMVKHKQAMPYDKPSHEVNIQKGTPLYNLLGLEKIGVNSLHHQAIKDLAPCLVPMAFTDDGLFEAVFYPEKKFCWAVQWHPEFSFTSDQNQRKIFEAFLKSMQDNCVISKDTISEPELSYRNDDFIFGEDFSEYREEEKITLYYDCKGYSEEEKYLTLNFQKYSFKYVEYREVVHNSHGTDWDSYTDEKDISLEEAIQYIKDTPKLGKTREADPAVLESEKKEVLEKLTAFHERTKAIIENAQNLLVQCNKWYRESNHSLKKIIYLSEKTSVFLLDDTAVVKFSVNKSGYSCIPDYDKLHGNAEIINVVYTHYLKKANKENDIEVTRMLLESEGACKINIVEKGIQIAAGLAKLHAAGYVHLDVKPANIFHDAYNRCMLGDLNSCRKVEDQYRHWIQGSRDYLAPEIISHKPYSFSSDLYSWGLLMLNFGLSERDRVTSENLKSIEFKKAKNGLTSVLIQKMDGKECTIDARYEKEDVRKCFDRFWIIVKKCLSKNPKNRYSNAGELLKDLLKMIEECNYFEDIADARPVVYNGKLYLEVKPAALKMSNGAFIRDIYKMVSHPFLSNQEGDCSEFLDMVSEWIATPECLLIGKDEISAWDWCWSYHESNDHITYSWSKEYEICEYLTHYKGIRRISGEYPDNTGDESFDEILTDPWGLKGTYGYYDHVYDTKDE